MTFALVAGMALRLLQSSVIRAEYGENQFAKTAHVEDFGATRLLFAKKLGVKIVGRYFAYYCTSLCTSLEERMEMHHSSV